MNSIFKVNNTMEIVYRTYGLAEKDLTHTQANWSNVHNFRIFVKI